MNDWEKTRISDVARVRHGFAFDGSSFSTDDSLPTLMTPGNFAIGGGFVEAKPKTFAGEVPRAYVLEPGAVIVTMTDLSKAGDTLGYSARVPGARTYLHNQRIGLLEPIAPEQASLEFLYYLLQTAEYRAQIIATATGSTVRHTSPSRIGEHVFLRPPLEEQRRIVDVLGALDDLIDTNVVLAAGCEELARSIAASIHHSVQLGALAVVGAAKAVTPVGLVAHFSLPAFDSGRSPELVDGSAIKSGKLAFDESAVLVSRLNPHIPRIWAAYPIPERQNLASTEFVPIIGTEAATEEVFAVASAEQFVKQMRSRVTGTTGSHQRVDKSALLELEVPDVRRLSNDERLLIRNLVIESDASRSMASQLRRTRDELLPLLMSGEVRVGHVSEAGVKGAE